MTGERELAWQVAGVSKNLREGNETGRGAKTNLNEGNKTGRKCEK